MMMALVMLPCDLPWWTSVQRHLKHLLLASSPAKLAASMLKIHDMCNIGIDPEDDVKDPELMKGLEQFLTEEMEEEERRHFLDNTIRIMVMTAKQWLTIEDWLECTLPLCKLLVRHEGRPERCESEDALRVCFATNRVGGDVLIDGESQESLSMFMMPELLPVMLSVEALEDNEVLKVENVRIFSRISDRKHKSNIEFLEEPTTVTVCMMDAEDYSALPLSQWEEDNVLRELNKCLLGFQQTPMQSRDTQRHERRLSPIGESFSHTPPEVEASVVIKQASSCSTLNSCNSRSPSPQNYCANTLNLNDPSVEILKRKCWLTPDVATLNNRRGRFIVLGSSGECLPVTRSPVHGQLDGQEDSLYSSCNSSDEEFHSANDSFDYGKYGSEDEGKGESARPNSFQYCKELSTEERRLSFAGRLREALQREADNSSSTTGDWSTDSSSYAVGISISGAELNDNDIRVKRGGSVGFVLTEKETVSNGNRSPRHRPLGRKETGNSSKYSFSTEYTSELEEVYEQFNHWLNDPIVDSESGEHKPREMDSRDLAVIRFAGSLLKRTLSESVAGGGTDEAEAAELYPRDRAAPRRLALAARSLSLELARHRHRLAAQLKRKIKEFVPEKILQKELTSDTDGDFETNELDLTSFSNSTETNSTQVSCPSIRKKKLNWMINMIVETIEEHVECEPLSQLAHKIVSGGSCRPVATGNWGCGQRQRGHPQLKLLLQWLAASVAGVPALIYYTYANEKLVKVVGPCARSARIATTILLANPTVKQQCVHCCVLAWRLDTVARVVVDRKWTVGQLTRAVLQYARRTLREPRAPHDSHSLFDDLIGIEKIPEEL
ncbi:hypothetical protein MSG28_000472 [Choristoneura fumiferana]|uniref:Uncharacterized protein n=1 Tax=Choristoneura fumiferana TaxID=7141 RepID=A0ACC0K0W7_CHOFU|nr:hypothetical protein MSG28_000472 [Choristoneura fumiferana]